MASGFPWYIALISWLETLLFSPSRELSTSSTPAYLIWQQIALSHHHPFLFKIALMSLRYVQSPQNGTWALFWISNFSSLHCPSLPTLGLCAPQPCMLQPIHTAQPLLLGPLCLYLPSIWQLIPEGSRSLPLHIPSLWVCSQSSWSYSFALHSLSLAYALLGHNTLILYGLVGRKQKT